MLEHLLLWFAVGKIIEKKLDCRLQVIFTNWHRLALIDESDILNNFIYLDNITIYYKIMWKKTRENYLIGRLTTTKHVIVKINGNIT